MITKLNLHALHDICSYILYLFLENKTAQYQLLQYAEVYWYAEHTP